MASNAFAVPTGTGSGIDQCSQSGCGSSSSWARSHTVIVSAGRRRISSSEVGVASPRSRPARRGGGERAGMDPLGRVGAGTERRRAGGRGPQAGGEL